MQNNQGNLQDLSKCTVAIQKTGENGRILGTGVIVTDDGLIVTCYHVVGNIKTKTLDRTVDIYFSSAPESKGQADVLKKYCNSELDIAILQLQEKKLPEKVIVANLSETIDPTHTFRSFGFRKPAEIKGLNAAGEVRGKVLKKSDEDSELQELIQLYSNEIGPGMSGAPILDKEINRVIGIVSEHYRSQSDVDNNLSFAIPIESILKEIPAEIESILKEKNPGLKPISNFLTKLNTRDIWYQKIDELYVPPLEFDEIEKTLNQYRLVFITGTKEYGKTYTAIELLWQYYKKGYEPKYVLESAKEELSEIVDKLLGLDEKLKKHVIYFEDPVGKTAYMRNEKFERHIADIRDVLNRQDTYIIITMREEIYRRFSPIGEIDPKKYVKKLNIGKRSYNFEKRKEMLLKWATVMSCKWIEDEKLKNTISECIVHESNLPTPLNIKDFVMATIDKKDEIKDEKVLLNILHEKSKATAESFASEIKVMAKDKILFLSFLFISDEFFISFIKAKYEELLAELNIKKDDWTFQRSLKDFKDDKIGIMGERVMFSHPSYSEALPYLILEDKEEKIPTDIYIEIFSKVFSKLANERYATESLARVITTNFDIMPEDARNLVFTLADNSSTAESVSNILQVNFDRLPGDYIYKLLIRLVSKNYTFWDTVGAIVSTIGSNFDKLPENTRSLLFTLADNDNNDAALILASALRDNFDNLREDVKYRLLEKIVETNSKAWDSGKNTSSAEVIVGLLLSNYYKLPNDVRNLLFTLADKTATAKHMSGMLRYYFHDLPEDVRNVLLTKLAEDERIDYNLAETILCNFDRVSDTIQNLLFELADDQETALMLAKIISSNFDKLSDSVRNELLFKLAKNEETARSVSYIISSNFDKLQENVRNELLIKLTDKKEAGENVASIVAENFDKLPEDVQNLLFELAANKATAYDVAEAVGSKYYNLPDNIRNELLIKRLPVNAEIAQKLAYTLSYDFDKLPENMRDEALIKVADSYDQETALMLAKIISSNFDKLSDSVRNELLLKLADKEIDLHVAYIISSNFDNLSDSVRNELLLKLADNKETALHVAYIISSNFDKLSDSVRNELLLKLADNKETALHVAYIISSNFDKLQEGAQKLLFKLADNKEAAGDVARAISSNFDKLPENVRNELLLKLAEDKDTAGSVASPVSENFDKLPEDVQNLLFKLAEDKDTAGSVASAITYNFDKLPEDVQNLLFKLAKDKDTAYNVVYAISSNFDKLPENVRNELLLIDNIRNELLLKLAENKGASKDVASTVSENFDKLPEDVQNLLFKLAKDKATAYNVAKAVSNNFDKLPENVRNELFLKVAENEAAGVADVLYSNFDKVPENVREELRRKLYNGL